MFNLGSYNSRGLPKTKKDLLLRPDFLSVLLNNDVTCIQETWFSKQDLSNLNNLHNDYHGIGVSTTDFRDKIVHGHPPGGVAIFWHISLEQYIKPIDLAVDWCVAVEFNIGITKCVVLNLYIPYQCAENEEKYLEDLGEINTILQELDNTCYVIVGDWNADLRNVLYLLPTC